MDRAPPLQNPEVILRQERGEVDHGKQDGGSLERFERQRHKRACPGTELDARAEHHLKKAIIPTAKRAEPLQSSAAGRRASAFC